VIFNNITTYYDTLGRLIKTKDPDLYISRIAYDQLNRVKTVTDAKNRSSQIEYDNNSNITKTTDPNGKSVLMEYDIFGDMNKMTDPMGRIMNFEYDELHRMKSSLDPMGRKTDYDYDPYCGTTTKTDPMGWTTTISKDLLCRVQNVRYDTTFFKYYYDNESRLTAVTSTKAMPVLGETTYGGATKLGTKKYGETVYGSSSETAKYGYTPSDNIQYFYDSDSRLTQINFGTNQLSIKYEYDDAGRLTRITDVNGVQTQFEYTDRDQLYKAKTGGSIATYTYDDAGRNTRITYPNGIYRDNTFNDRSLITQIKYTKSTSTLLKFDYEYDKIGNITRKKITWKSGKITDWHYQYDNLNRLKTVTLTKNNRTTKTYYMYDKVGNRLMKDVRSTMVSMPDTTPYEYNADNELLSAGDTDFEFDLNGNMVSKKEQDGDETQYVYNKMGKMIKLIKPDGSTTKYYYRHDGLRYRKIEGDGDEILYYWGAGSIPPLLSERKATHGSSTVTKLASYPPGVPGFKLFGKQSGMFYYLTDHLGSVYYVTDAKANIINSYDYDEFGVVTTKNEHLYLGSKLYNPKGFTGEPQHAEEDGLIYLRQRYYSPSEGRFTQKDINLDINCYIYAFNNPILFVDPNGLDYLVYYRTEGKLIWYDSNGKYVESWNANSGNPSANFAPIPRGTYVVNPSDIEEIKTEGDLIGWGPLAVPITPTLFTRIGLKIIARGSFYIHGGKNPGTAGCIEIAEYTEEQEQLKYFMSKLQKYDAPILLYVQDGSFNSVYGQGSYSGVAPSYDTDISIKYNLSTGISPVR